MKDVRVVLFCSMYRGYAMLSKLLALQETCSNVQIVGIVTDDPSQTWCNPSRRVWRYSQSPDEPTMVNQLAEEHSIPVWKGKVNTQEFHKLFCDQWRPDICYMGVFGQKIPESIWAVPLYGFLNLHTCSGQLWPSDAGGDPVTKILQQGNNQASLALHQIDNEWDEGELVAFSKFFPVSYHDDPIDIQKRSAPIAADMMEWHLVETFKLQRSTIEPRFVAADSLAIEHLMKDSRRSSALRA